MITCISPFAGCLSVTNSKPIYKLDVPMMKWPRAPFPKYKYPLEHHESENQAKDLRCLEEVEETIYQHSYTMPVAAVIVEPIQSEGGIYSIPIIVSELLLFTAYR